MKSVNNNLPTPDDGIIIPELTICSAAENSSLPLNTGKPVIIIVHGCKGSAARFRSLAEVFAFNGQQAFCFNYNDRESLAKTARILTLGLSVPLCKLISGDKWYEITHPSPFIQKPGKLAVQVDKHFQIVTDESGSCRSLNAEGECAEDDFVFSLDEQYFDRIDDSYKVENIEVVAGHSEIVGDDNVQPDKLIKILQSKGIMAQTDPRFQGEFEQLLTRLYH